LDRTIRQKSILFFFFFNLTREDETVFLRLNIISDCDGDMGYYNPLKFDLDQEYQLSRLLRKDEK
jgi:hypothetical protein